MFVPFELFMSFFCIRNLIKQEKHIKFIYSACLFLGCKNVGLRDLRFNKPAYTHKKSKCWCQKCTKPASTQKTKILIGKSHQTCIYSKKSKEQKSQTLCGTDWRRWIGFWLCCFLSICRFGDFSLSKLLIFLSTFRFCVLLASKFWFLLSICKFCAL